jgi:hypothetical protein
MQRRGPGVASIAAWLTIGLPIAIVMSPWLADTTTLSGGDWDVELAHRMLTSASLRAGEGPFWNPFACGGVPAWGFVEGGTTLVSPWLLAYLALPLSLALRVETAGSALMGALGAYAAAGRLTRSAAARAFVVALWAVDGRWALQAKAGHTWHLLYAWMPWALYLLDRTFEANARRRDTVLLAGTFALILYGGGMYPLPHTVLALAIYASGRAIAERSWRPLAKLGAAGGLGVLLAAPKLVPMMHVYATTPRLIASDEVFPARALWAALTSHDQALSRAMRDLGLPYAWHEYGIYISVVGLVALAVASMVVWKPRENALRAGGLLFAVLGLGAFHRFAPWSLVHAHVPFFSSQHVPTRFLYPAVLLLALAGAPAVGLLAAKRRWLEPVLAVAVLALAVDIAWVSRSTMDETMHLRMPEMNVGASFQQLEKPVLRAMPLVSATLGNFGVIQCYGMLEHSVGARSVTDPRYRGEAFVLPPPSDAPATSTRAAVLSFLPHRVVVDARDAIAGSTVVLNANDDDGWTSPDGEIVDVDQAVGVRLAAPHETVTFDFRPRGLAPGLLLGVVGLLACGWLLRRDRVAG